MKRRWLLLPVALLLVITGFFVFGCKEEDGDSGKKPNGPVVPPEDNFTQYTAEANNGRLHKENTTIVTLTFDKLVPRNTLATEHVTVIEGTGKISSFDLLNANADTRNLRNMIVEKEGTIIITIDYEGIDPNPREVMVYKKLGYTADSSVTINDIVNIGERTAGQNITFARYDGDPMAIIPPRTREPISGISATSPAFSEVLVNFNPPLDLRTTDYVELRWIDMVWEGFKDDGMYDFENESTTPATTNDPNAYTNTRFDLHNVQFLLDMTTTTGARVRFQRISETNTSTRAKQPVKFERSHIQTGSGNTAWDDGHQISSITLIASGMQLRSPHNGHWPGITADRNPVIDDTYIISLAIDANKPPPRKTLYDRDNGGWNTDLIKNPKMGMEDFVFKAPCGEAVCTNPLEHSRDAADPKGLNVMDGRPSRIIWDPIDISVPAGATPYSFVRAQVQASGLSWHGNGVISTPVDIPPADSFIRMNFNPGGGNGNSAWGIPFEHPSYGAVEFLYDRFSGIFVQGNGDGQIQLNILYIE